MGECAVQRSCLVKKDSTCFVCFAVFALFAFQEEYKEDRDRRRLDTVVWKRMERRAADTFTLLPTRLFWFPDGGYLDVCDHVCVCSV